MLPLFDDLDERQRRTIDLLHSVPGWPIDFGKDADLIRRLKDVYPNIDLYEEAVGFATWMADHEQKKQIKYRARFRNWVKKANEFQSRKGYKAPSSGGHGKSGEVRESW